MKDIIFWGFCVRWTDEVSGIYGRRVSDPKQVITQIVSILSCEHPRCWIHRGRNPGRAVTNFKRKGRSASYMRMGKNWTVENEDTHWQRCFHSFGNNLLHSLGPRRVFAPLLKRDSQFRQFPRLERMLFEELVEVRLNPKGFLLFTPFSNEVEDQGRRDTQRTQYSQYSQPIHADPETDSSDTIKRSNDKLHDSRLQPHTPAVKFSPRLAGRERGSGEDVPELPAQFFPGRASSGFRTQSHFLPVYVPHELWCS